MKTKTNTFDFAKKILKSFKNSDDSGKAVIVLDNIDIYYSDMRSAKKNKKKYIKDSLFDF